MPSPNAAAASPNSEVSNSWKVSKNVTAANQRVPWPLAEFGGQVLIRQLAAVAEVAECGRGSDVLRRCEQVLSYLASFGDAGLAGQVVEALIEGPHDALDAQSINPGQSVGHVKIL